MSVVISFRVWCTVNVSEGTRALHRIYIIYDKEVELLFVHEHVLRPSHVNLIQAWARVIHRLSMKEFTTIIFQLRLNIPTQTIHQMKAMKLYIPEFNTYCYYVGMSALCISLFSTKAHTE